ncbi:MAG: PDZ domain-containing protein [Gloeobacteraceae cyanobacterium ES-bin-144]|nr:PDZ domain-containing protein [Verrucomicrobiales bacterium]
MSANQIKMFLCCGLITTSWGQQSLESAYRTTGPAVVAAFESQRAVLQTSSAVVLNGRDELAYGVVISAEGYILTKASEMPETNRVSVRVDQANYPDVEVLRIDPTWDVALLKVDATGLIPVNYAPTSDQPQGTWVVANGATTRTNRRLLAGILSAKSREIPAAGGAALGVVLKSGSKTLEIDEVNEKSGAKEAGLQKGDVILTMEGKAVAKFEDLSEMLKDRKAGSIVRITYRRGKETKSAEVRLAAKGDLFNDQMTRNDAMSGDFSKRRSGFPRVIQHDILCSSRTIGGPLLDLDGRCIGMNIARANRAETFAIPVEELKEIAGRLMKQAAQSPPAIENNSEPK